MWRSTESWNAVSDRRKKRNVRSNRNRYILESDIWKLFVPLRYKIPLQFCLERENVQFRSWAQRLNFVRCFRCTFKHPRWKKCLRWIFRIFERNDRHTASPTWRNWILLRSCVSLNCRQFFIVAGENFRVLNYVFFKIIVTRWQFLLI